MFRHRSFGGIGCCGYLCRIGAFLKCAWLLRWIWEGRTTGEQTAAMRLLDATTDPKQHLLNQMPVLYIPRDALHAVIKPEKGVPSSPDDAVYFGERANVYEHCKAWNAVYMPAARQQGNKWQTVVPKTHSHGRAGSDASITFLRCKQSIVISYRTLLYSVVERDTAGLSCYQ